MAVVGSAEVIVRAITTQVKKDIEKAFKDARAAIRAEGEAAGRDYAEGIKQGLSGVDMSGVIEGALGSGAADAARDAGRQAGTAFGDGMNDSMGNLDFDSNIVSDRLRETSEESISKMESAVEERMTQAGSRGGMSFGRALDTALNSSFSKSAMAASRSFTMLIGASNTLGPALAGLVGMLSSVVSGLFAMGAAAAQAASALMVIPTGISTLLQGLAAVKLGFSGVGEAMKLGTKASEAAESQDQASAASAYAVADAQKALERARMAASDAAVDAAQRVADAESDVADAQREVHDAQRALNAARQEGIESLQQLAFEAEGAALSEERAALRLEEAHEKLKLATQLPPDNRARREAELAFKEAELGYRMAKDRNGDLQKEQKKAAKAGVKGTQEVTAAREKVNSAQEKLAGAEEQLAKARLARQRQERDSALAIADAQERLRRANEAAAGAMSDAAKAADEYQAALDKLGKPAAKFVEYMVSIQDEFDGLKKSAGQEMFGPMKSTMETLVRNVFPVLNDELKVTGERVGDAALGFGEVFEKGSKGFGRLRGIMETNNEILGIFTERNENGENAVSELTRVVLRLLRAAGPMTKRFAEWIRGLIGAAEAATDTKDEMDELRARFKKAGDVAALLGKIFGNIWGILKNLGKAADDSGLSLLESFEKATRKLEKFLGKPKQQKDLEKFFEDVAYNMRAIGRLVSKIGEEFLGLGDNKGIGKFADSLIPAVENVGDIMDKMTEASPEVGKFLTELTELGEGLTNSEGIEKFVNNLTWVVDKIGDIVNSDFGQKVLGWAATIASFTRVIGLVLIPLGFLFKAIIGGPLRVIASFRKLQSFWGRMKKGFTALREGKGLKAAFGEMAKGSDNAKKAFEEQMVTDKLKIEVLEKLEKQAYQTADALEKLKREGMPAADAAKDAAQGAAASADDAVVAATGDPDAAAAAGDKRKPKHKKSRIQVFKDRLKGRNEGGFVDFSKSAKKHLDVADKATTKATGRMRGSITKMGRPVKALGKGVGKLGGAFKVAGGGMLGLVGGPMGAIMLAIPLVVKGLQMLYKKSPEFRKFVDTVVEKLKQFGEWAKKIFNKYVLPALETFFGWLNDNMPKIRDFFVSAFEKIAAVVGWVVGFIKKHWKTLGTIISFVVFGPIGAAIFWIITHWKEIKEKTKAMIDAVKKKWNEFRDKIAEVIQKIRDKWQVWVDRFNYVRDKIGDGVDAIRDKWQEFRDRINEIVENVKDKWESFVDKIKDIKSRIGDIVQGIKDFFTGIPEAVSSAFSNLGGNIKNGLNAFIRLINEQLIGRINDKIPGPGPIPEIPQMATGGRVRGQGGPTQDNLLRRLSAGEFVIPTRKARAVGYDVLEFIRRTGRLPATPFAVGGIARARSGGVYAQLAEAGRDERVEPLGRDGLSARDRAMLDMLKQMMANSGGDTYQVYPSPGMDEVELAHNIYQKVRFNRRAGK